MLHIGFTLYPSPHLVLTEHGYTKHYYAGAERLAARQGGGFGRPVLGGCPEFADKATILFDQSLQQVPRLATPPEPHLREEWHLDEVYDNLTKELFDLPEELVIHAEIKVDEFLQAMQNLAASEAEPDVYFYHSDHLGSASWITDKDGNPVQHLQYLPYGEPYINQRTTGYNERFTFTGKERDEETGYSYFGARYMDHDLMTMWLSVDPMADKYPSISPYAYCNWNPVKLVDPDGNEAIDNDDWYINSKGEVRWFNSTAEKYTYEGEEYTRYGQTASMTNSNGEYVYGDQYGNTHSSKSLREFSVTETLSDFERTMLNPLVQIIHQSAPDFWGHPVTGAVVDATLFVVTGGTETVAKGVVKAYLKHKAKSLPVRQSSSNVSTTASHIREWLGEGRCKINKHGDPVFTSKDNLRKFRIDINNTQGDKIHMHLERRTPNGNWKDATPTHRLYPKQ